jgi:cation diffusion facilitator family transporter
MAERQDPARSVHAALAANTAIAVVKIVAGIVSGSAAMMAEAAHSIADTGNQALLLVGIRRSRRRPDAAHPFGYGRERFFFGFLVAISLFTIGATFSVLHGISGLVDGGEPPHAPVALAVIAISAVLEGSALRTAWRQFDAKRPHKGVWRDLREMKDPEVLTVIGEDSAAISGLAVAAAGIVLSDVTHSSVPDSVGSIVIGLILAAVAFFLGRESRDLLLGEPAAVEVQDGIRSAVASTADVDEVVSLVTVHTGPDDLFIGLEVAFRDDLTTDDVERAVDRVEESVRTVAPGARWILVEPELRHAERERVAANAGRGRGAGAYRAR